MDNVKRRKGWFLSLGCFIRFQGKKTQLQTAQRSQHSMQRRLIEERASEPGRSHDIVENG
ncbi:hypothetical protein KSX_52360 [Ktedonospora formicarum]|uniref:Uncharacterized protein n=1 Tax=Ktedonospora formicarum TaxID=2778364 RepID=A0A8J3I770_9CHLR|nr:hypothetical protein KSX_52360 [Ktedonospora formicarum]